MQNYEARAVVYSRGVVLCNFYECVNLIRSIFFYFFKLLSRSELYHPLTLTEVTY